jgi:hypothetical protein
VMDKNRLLILTTLATANLITLLFIFYTIKTLLSIINGIVF